MTSPLVKGVKHKRVDATAKTTECGKPVAGLIAVLQWSEASCGSCWARYRARNKKGKSRAWYEYSLGKRR